MRVTTRQIVIGVLVMASFGLRAEVEQWLNRMDGAIDSVSYRGTVVSASSGKVHTLRVLHRVDAQGIRERIYALDGPPREVVRGPDGVRCLIAGQKSVVVQTPLAARLLERIPLEQIFGEDAVYRAALTGHDRVAGRATRTIDIVPNDDYRYARKLWLDEQTGLLLRSALIRRDEQVVEQVAFVEIELDADIDDAELESALGAEPFSAHAEPASTPADASAVGDPVWLPADLPPGFRLVSVGRGRAGPQSYEQLLFSDGLSSFSVYLEPAAEGAVEALLQARGGTHIFSDMVEGSLVTVIGEVPAPTVRMVGSRLRRSVR